MSLSLFYTDLKTKLTTDVPELKTIRLFNNQFQRDQIESAFAYPTCFIHFSNIEWERYLAGIQKAENLQITLHVGFVSYEDEHTDFWTITDKIFKSLNGWSDNYFSPMTRVSEIQDVDHDNVIVWQMVFEIDELLDCTDYVHGDKQTTTATEIDITAQLDIDNIKIRTGDGSIIDLSPLPNTLTATALFDLDLRDPSKLEIGTGQTLHRITDATLNGHDFISIEGENVPKIVEVNGLNAVQFDNSEILKSQTTIDLSGLNKHSYFFVMRTRQSDLATNGVFYESSENQNLITTGFVANTQANGELLATHRGNNNYTQAKVLFSNVPYDETFILYVTHDKTSPGNDEINIWINDIDVDVDTGLINDNTNNFGNHTHYIGRRFDSTGRFIGEVLRVVQYDSPLSDAERTSVHDYLAGIYVS